LEEFSNLARLELRCCRITKIENLSALTNLKLLTLSSNLITEINEEDIGQWDTLEDLGLFGNFLGNLNNYEENEKIFENILNLFAEKIPNLKNLYLSGNHFLKIKDWKLKVKIKLKSLKLLDGILVSLNI
jgi:protein phosphatase 1 regulatory subunit 7